MSRIDDLSSSDEFAVLKAGLLYVWNGVAVFCALLYLTGNIAKSLLMAAFVLVSCVLGYGRRRVIQGGFAIVILAILISYGFSTPDRWFELAKQVPNAVSYVWNRSNQ